MKKHIPLLPALVLLFSLTACGKPTEKENPYRMKTYTLDSYENGELVNRAECVYTYNDHGYLSQLQYYLDGELSHTQYNETDEFGNVTRTVTETTDGNSSIMEYTLTLDEKHRVIHEETSQKDADGNTGDFSTSSTEITYDRHGNEIQRTIHSILDGRSGTSWIDLTYDRDGNLIEKITRLNYGTEGITKENTRNYSITKYEYTEGKLTRCESYNYKDELEEYEEYTYDETGLIQTALRYHADGSPYSKTVTTFDEYGNMLTTEIYKLRDDGIEPVDDLVDLVYTATYEPIPNN